jgi:hypothetical protein
MQQQWYHLCVESLVWGGGYRKERGRGSQQLEPTANIVSKAVLGYDLPLHLFCYLMQ